MRLIFEIGSTRSGAFLTSIVRICYVRNSKKMIVSLESLCAFDRNCLKFDNKLSIVSNNKPQLEKRYPISASPLFQFLCIKALCLRAFEHSNVAFLIEHRIERKFYYRVLRGVAFSVLCKFFFVFFLRFVVVRLFFGSTV